MLNKQLLSPKSIAVIGASNDVSKPGGKILLNLQEHKYKGKLYAVNPRDPEIQGIKTFSTVDELPMIDLAILAIPAKLCPKTVEILAYTKKTKAFIIISAGFSEESEQGAEWERQMVETVKSVGGVLIGPNCIGVLTPEYAGVFTSPIPKFDPRGCDFVSGSGATAVFIMESGIPKGLHFANVFSVGNSAQIGVEEVLEYWDKTYDPETSAPVKMLYVESIHNPDKFLWHASSLIRKGCKIAGIKAGSSEAGSRAASSHTGAMTSSDSAVEALFRKSGIVRCYGREELTTVASIFMFEELKGKNIAIITHAGGPAVMLTDALEDGGLRIPHLPDTKAKAALKDKLFPGSSVENPIDFLSTGNAEQLGAIIDACENDFEDIDGMAVIFGSPGLQPVTDVYKVLIDKMKTCKKPIYPILPSVINVQKDVAYFISSGNVNFPDEVLLARALTKVYRTPKPSDENIYLEGVDVAEIRRVVESCENGYMPPEKIHALLKAASIPFAQERVAKSIDEAAEAAKKLGFPLVMKVVGPLHKTEVGGVSLNIRDEEMVRKEFTRLMKIKDTTAVLMAEQAEGIELFIGASYQDKFGHVMLCGMGGIFVEVFKDITSGLAPLTFPEAHSMIRNLKAYKIINGYRGMEGVDKDKFAEIIVRLSSMLRFAVEIKELDLNPLLGKGNRILAVDARIRVEK
ncbi:acetate--CoA ligase family protein [Prolixibacter sp. SD074]|uniref:acetate--CoA ligase family protein n=1 Tax=Prolixibacter sp. SD074 TaxID=2652391 RepID=UPI001275EC45|nr:acetate--CoA ligase [Prolixibacter sp. SD074]GET29706.1 acetyl-CoA synthetase [Prolixibacter sp. SD074]